MQDSLDETIEFDTTQADKEQFFAALGDADYIKLNREFVDDDPSYTMSFESITDMKNQILDDPSVSFPIEPTPAMQDTCSKLSDPTGYGDETSASENLASYSEKLLETTNIVAASTSQAPDQIETEQAHMIHLKPSKESQLHNESNNHNLTFDDFLKLNNMEANHDDKLRSKSSSPKKATNNAVEARKDSRIPTPIKGQTRITTNKKLNSDKAVKVQPKGSKPLVSQKRDILKRTNEKFKSKIIDETKPKDVKNETRLNEVQDTTIINLEREQLENEIKKKESNLIDSQNENSKQKQVILEKEAKIDELTQQINILEKMLQTEKEKNTLAHQAKHGHQLSDEQVQSLAQELKEQETLIKGFQNENEKLVMQIKELKQQMRESEELFVVKQENLQRENATLKTAAQATNVDNSAKTRAKIDQQTKKIEDLQRENFLLKSEYDLKISGLESKVAELSAERDSLANANPAKMAAMKAEHEALAEEYKRKIVELENKLEFSMQKIQDTQDAHQRLEQLESQNSELIEQLLQFSQKKITRSPQDIKKIAELERKLSSNKSKVSVTSIITDDKEHILLLKQRISSLEQEIFQIKSESLKAGTLLNNDYQKKLKALEKTISEKDALIKEFRLKPVEQQPKTPLNEVKDQSNVPTNHETQLIKLRKHVVELESLMDQQNIRIEQLSYDKSQLSKELEKRLQEKDDMILDYESQMNRLRSHIRESLSVDTSDLERQIAKLKGELEIAKNKLEISEGTRKAVHESTISILKQAQEESSKLALSHHERALEVLRRELRTEAKQSSQSNVDANAGLLRQRIKDLEQIIQHANDKLAQQEVIKMQFEAQQLIIQKLESQIEQLKNEKGQLDVLFERSKQSLPPSIQHYQALTLKIQQLERQLDQPVVHDKCEQEKHNLVSFLYQKDQVIKTCQSEITFLLDEIRKLR